MDVTWIYGAVAIGGIIVTAISGERYRRKYNKLKSEYDKRCEELEHALGEVGRDKILIESMQESNADFVERIGEYKHLMTSGCRNLKVKQYAIPDIPELPKFSIAVVGQDTINPDLDFIVKAFTADNEEDREFAIREAEELIETINKA